jgi:hypothetical protein
MNLSEKIELKINNIKYIGKWNFFYSTSSIS